METPAALPVRGPAWRALLAGLALSATAGAPLVARADPGYYLVRPYSEPGQTTVDLRYWSVKSEYGGATLWPELGLRHGVTSRWSTELLLSWIGPTMHEQTLSSINWVNQVLFTQGDTPYDLGLHLQLIRNRGQGNAVEAGPIFQTEIGLTQLNLNLFLMHDATARRRNEARLQWQALHRWAAGWRAGVQGFAEPRNWRAGPTLRVALAERVDLQAAYLFGHTYGDRGDMFSATVQIGF